jgi:3-deoxy-7-phosphoheptulonate synthase
MSPTTDTAMAEEAEPDSSEAEEKLLSVAALRCFAPLTRRGASTVARARHEFTEILEGRDRRLVLIVGPCSIHNVHAALAYADRIRILRKRFGDKLLIIMRTYLEKPRTTIGWKGLLTDPNLDGSCDLNQGLLLGRRLLAELADMGVPAATELVDPHLTHHLADALTWASIGARTVESQPHRQLASDLPLPVGFKNGTQGEIQVAIDAVVSASHPHAFPGVGADGGMRIIRSRGNRHTHVVLRGGRNAAGYFSNCDPATLQGLPHTLRKLGLPPRVMVDCSHANSGFRPEKQVELALALLEEHAAGARSVFGLMLESNLAPGNQKLGGDQTTVCPDLSITDPCLGIEETEALVEQLHAHLTQSRVLAASCTPSW